MDANEHRRPVITVGARLPIYVNYVYFEKRRVHSVGHMGPGGLFAPMLIYTNCGLCFFLPGVSHRNVCVFRYCRVRGGVFERHQPSVSRWLYVCIWSGKRILALKKTRISVWCMTGPLLRKNYSKDGRENKIITYELLYNAVFTILCVAAPGVGVGYYRGNRVRNRNWT